MRFQAPRVLVLSSAMALVVSLLPWPEPAHGASFSVNSTIDAPDAKPGDGKCATAAGVCTLRAAIMEANARGSGHTIVLSAGQSYTLALPPAGETNTTDPVSAAAKGDLDIGVHLSITGNGATVDAGGTATQDRAFDIRANVKVTMTNLTVRNGRTTAGQSGAGIRTFGTLTLDEVTLRDNAAIGSNGGGIRSDGSLTVKNSQILNNRADEGGGIRTRGRLTVTNSTIDGNWAGYNLDHTWRVNGYGGGIDIDSGAAASISGSSISNNDSSYEAGGIDADGTLTLGSGNTFSGNTAAGEPDTNNCDPSSAC